MKRFLSAMLSLAMMATMSTAAFAAETEHTMNQIWLTDDGLNTAISKLTAEVVKGGDILCATVPMELPVMADTKGNITVPTDAKIVNNGDTAIEITEIKISNHSTTGGSFSNYRITTYEDAPTDTRNARVLGVKFRGDTGTTYSIQDITYGISLTLSKDNWKIEANDELPLNMEVSANKQFYASQLQSGEFGSVEFTIAIVK